MSERRAKIDIEHELPKTRRCELLDVARSTAYYRPEPVSAQELALMRLTDEIHLQRPFYGARRLRDEFEERGHSVNRKRIQRLMRRIGLTALYPRRRTSQPGKGHEIYPYLLRDLSIERANQVWATRVRQIWSAPRLQEEVSVGQEVQLLTYIRPSMGLKIPALMESADP